MATEPEIVGHCPSCGKKWRTAAANAGRRFQCGACGVVVVATTATPPPTPVPPPPPAPTKPAPAEPTVIIREIIREVPAPPRRSCLGCSPVGCLTILGLMFVAGIVISIQSPPGRRPTAGVPAVEESRPARLTVGEVGQLAGLHNGIWLARTDADWDPMIDAQIAAAQGGPGSGAPLNRLAEAGRVRFYAIGTKIQVMERAVFSSRVEVIEGPDKGESGWVQNEFVRPLP